MYDRTGVGPGMGNAERRIVVRVTEFDLALSAAFFALSLTWFEYVRIFHEGFGVLAGRGATLLGWLSLLALALVLGLLAWSSYRKRSIPFAAIAALLLALSMFLVLRELLELRRQIEYLQLLGGLLGAALVSFSVARLPRPAAGTRDRLRSAARPKRFSGRIAAPAVFVSLHTATCARTAKPPLDSVAIQAQRIL